MRLEDISPNFNNWFLGSKIEKNGKPIKLYHGTSKDSDFKSFKMQPQGIWFTKDPKEASDYATTNDSQNIVYDGGKFVHKNTASRVIPVYVKAENPKFFSSMPDELRFAGSKSNSGVGYRKDQALFWNKLKAEGHDAAVIGDFDVVVVFGSPNQIKSAISNKTFDATKKNIHESMPSSVLSTYADKFSDQFIDGPAKGPASNFTWRFEPNYPLNKIQDSPTEWKKWMSYEIKTWANEGQPDRFEDELKNPIREPIVLVETTDGVFVWDGNHRIGASYLSNKSTIPAVVGTPINSPILVERYEDITSVLAKWKDDPDIFVTFTDLPKVGINPKSGYKTPTGVYAYPLKEMWLDIQTYNIPFAGDRKWIHVLRAKSIIDVTEYSEEDLEKDIARLKPLLTKFMSDQSPEDIGRTSDLQYSKLEINVRDFINRALLKANPKNIPMAKIWNLTRETAAYFKTSEKHGLPSSLSAPKWTALMLFLGFGAVSDRKGTGLIHTNEPKQAVFFNPTYYQVIGSFRNIRKAHPEASHVIQIKNFEDLNFMLRSAGDATPEAVSLLYNQIRDLIKKGKSRNYSLSTVDRQSYIEISDMARMLFRREQLSVKEIVNMIFSSKIIDNESKAYALKRLIDGYGSGLVFLEEVVKNPNIMPLILKYTYHTKEEFIKYTKNMYAALGSKKELDRLNYLLSKI